MSLALGLTVNGLMGNRNSDFEILTFGKTWDKGEWLWKWLYFSRVTYVEQKVDPHVGWNINQRKIIPRKLYSC